MLSSEKDEKDRLYETYLEKAVYLTQLNREDAVRASEYIDSDEFQSFDVHSQNIILHMADLLEDKDLNDVENNPSLKKKLLKNDEIQAEFASVMAAMSNWQKWVHDPARATTEVLDRTAEHYPIPPIDWAAKALSSVSGIVETFGQNRLSKYTLSQEPPSKTSNVPKLVADLAGMAGIFLNFIHPVAPLIATLTAMVSPILLMVAAGFMAVTQIRNFVKSVKNLIKETKQKEPRETYKLRVRKRVIECVKEGASALFYIALTAVALAQFVSIFTNPIGLGVMTGISAGIGVGMIITTVVMQQLRKRTETRLSKLENTLGLRPELDTPQPKHGIGKGLKERANLAIKTLGRAPTVLPDTAGLERHKGLHAMHVAAKKKKANLVSHAKVMTLEAFHQLHDRSIEHLEREKQQAGSLYTGIKYESKIMDEKRTLLVEVPREGIGVVKGKASDRISRRQNAKNEVEMTLSPNPAEKSIEVFLDMHRELAPLRMDYCGDQKTVADILEVSKKLRIEVQLDERDLELVNPPHP